MQDEDVTVDEWPHPWGIWMNPRGKARVLRQVLRIYRAGAHADGDTLIRELGWKLPYVRYGLEP